MMDRHKKTSATRRARVQAEILRKTRLFVTDHSPLTVTYASLSASVGFTAETIRRHFPDIGALTLRAYTRELVAACRSTQVEITPRKALTSLIIQLTTAFIRHPSLGDGVLMQSRKPNDGQSAPYQALITTLNRSITAFRKEKSPKARSSRQLSASCVKRCVSWAQKYSAHNQTIDVDEIEAFAHRTVTKLRG